MSHKSSLLIQQKFYLKAEESAYSLFWLNSSLYLEAHMI